MPEKSIHEMEQYDLQEFLTQRRFHEHVNVVYPLDVNHEEAIFHERSIEMIDQEESDPLETGFQNEILEEIRISGDQTDLDIFKLLMSGCTEASEISRQLKISEKAVGKRLAKYKKLLQKNFKKNLRNRFRKAPFFRLVL